MCATAAEGGATSLPPPHPIPWRSTRDAHAPRRRQSLPPLPRRPRAAAGHDLFIMWRQHKAGKPLHHVTFNLGLKAYE